MPESTIIVNEISAIKEKPGALPRTAGRVSRGQPWRSPPCGMQSWTECLYHELVMSQWPPEMKSHDTKAVCLVVKLTRDKLMIVRLST